MEDLGKTDIAALKQHYKQLAIRFGGELLPPGKLLNQVGQFLLNSENEVEKAIDLFTYNGENYPNSASVYNSLGLAYERLENRDLAIVNYKKSLQINETNERIRARLESLAN